MEKLLQLGPLKIKKSPTPSKTPKSSEAPRKEIDNDPTYIKVKTEDLINLLHNHQVVVVSGASLTGKSRIISKAAKLKSADVENEYGLWEEIQGFGESVSFHFETYFFSSNLQYKFS